MEQVSTTMEDRIRQLMEASGLSQKDYAAKLEISPGSLSSIFNGRTRATNNFTKAIHRAFPTVNINWLLFGEGEMFGSSDGLAPSGASDPSLQSSDGNVSAPHCNRRMVMCRRLICFLLIRSNTLLWFSLPLCPVVRITVMARFIPM